MDAMFGLPRGSGSYQLTEQEAFLALTLFVSQFAARAGDDLSTLMGDISVGPDGRPLDPAAWDDWIECVRVAKGERPNDTSSTWKSLGRPSIER